MISSQHAKFCQLKLLLDPIPPKQIIGGIKPMASFVVEDNLYVSDQLSNSMQKYTLGEITQLVASQEFSGEGANGFANYDLTIDRVWMIGKNKKRLLLLDRDLHLKKEINTPDNTGFFFAHQGKHFL